MYFHLLLKSSENLIHYHAIHVVLLFLTLLHAIIIPHKWELTGLTSPSAFFPEASLIILAIPFKTVNLCSFL